jgi:hypothetical protein
MLQIDEDSQNKTILLSVTVLINDLQEVKHTIQCEAHWTASSLIRMCLMPFRDLRACTEYK